MATTSSTQNDNARDDLERCQKERVCGGRRLREYVRKERELVTHQHVRGGGDDDERKKAITFGIWEHTAKLFYGNPISPKVSREWRKKGKAAAKLSREF